MRPPREPSRRRPRAPPRRGDRLHRHGPLRPLFRHPGVTTCRSLPHPHSHVEGDRSLLAAALRGVCEETGPRPGDLPFTPQLLGAPVDIDVHDFDANPAKGEGASTLRAKLLDARERGLDGRPAPVNTSALIHDGHGRYLLRLRDPGTFALPGGGRTRDDVSLEAALRQELAKEATGLMVDQLAPHAPEEATSADGLAVPIQVFEGRWSGEPETVGPQEGVLLRWFTTDTLERLNPSPGLGYLIRRASARRQPAFPAPAAVRRGDTFPACATRLGVRGQQRGNPPARPGAT